MVDNTELFNSLKAYLLSSGHAPGKKIDTETALATRFGVSRYRIRQVMTTLAQMGLVNRSPRRGTVVCGVDEASLTSNIQMQMEVAGFDEAQLSEARQVVECSIMPLVVANATPELIADLDGMVERMAACGNNYAKADQCDRDFHLLLLQACGNKVLQVFSNVLVTIFEKTGYGSRFRNSDYDLDALLREHGRIVDAIREGDVKLASLRMREHLLEQSGRRRQQPKAHKKVRRPSRANVLLRRKKGRKIQAA